MSSHNIIGSEVFARRSLAPGIGVIREHRRAGPSLGLRLLIELGKFAAILAGLASLVAFAAAVR